MEVCLHIYQVHAISGSRPIEGHHLRKVILHNQVKSTFLAELNLVFIASFRLFVSHVVSVSCTHTQTPSVYSSAIILPTLPSITQFPVMNICHEHKNSPATYQRDFTQKAFKNYKKIRSAGQWHKFRRQLRAKLKETTLGKMK